MLKRLLLVLILALPASCTGAKAPPDLAEPPSSLPRVAVTTSAATLGGPAPTSPPSTASPATAPPTIAPPAQVSAPGTYEAAELVIGLRFSSEVADVTSADFEATAIAILNDSDGWQQSGFSFLADESSGLEVILAEADRVDALCLPLETYGKVSCQNGATVALNADRWRLGGEDWDSTVADYRTYLVNHEVGHLIGLRHPLERCPTAEKISALMEPQTNNLQGCRGNGIPLDWEVRWAANRPAVIGPDPDWDGPRPAWPVGP